MAWIVFAALVVGSSTVSYVLRERRHRRRWQLVGLPPVAAGTGAYRESQIVGGHLAEAPTPLRLMVFSCIVYGRAVTFALLATALYLAGVRTEALAVPTLHTMVGYFTAGGGVGAVAAMILASLVMRAGSDILVRDPRRAFGRTRDTALASAVLHGLVLVNAATGAWLVGTAGRDASRSLVTTRVVAGVALAHAIALLALAYAYRSQLEAKRPEVRI